MKSAALALGAAAAIKHCMSVWRVLQRHTHSFLLVAHEHRELTYNACCAHTHAAHKNQGTPTHMSPELFESGHVGKPSE